MEQKKMRPEVLITMIMIRWVRAEQRQRRKHRRLREVVERRTGYSAWGQTGGEHWGTHVLRWQTWSNSSRDINQQIQNLKGISVNAKKTNYSTSQFAAGTSSAAILNSFRQQWAFFAGFHGYPVGIRFSCPNERGSRLGSDSFNLFRTSLHCIYAKCLSDAHFCAFYPNSSCWLTFCEASINKTVISLIASRNSHPIA